MARSAKAQDTALSVLLQLLPGPHHDLWQARAAIRRSAADKLTADDPVDEQELKGLGLLARRRSEVPAITHVDGSARIQTVDAQRHGRFHRLLESFANQTGCPVLINTSFNVRGEPIVCSPAEAYRCFMATNMDVLVLEHYVLLKSEQRDAEDHPIDDYLAQFALD